MLLQVLRSTWVHVVHGQVVLCILPAADYDRVFGALEMIDVFVLFPLIKTFNLLLLYFRIDQYIRIKDPLYILSCVEPPASYANSGASQSRCGVV